MKTNAQTIMAANEEPVFSGRSLQALFLNVFMTGVLTFGGVGFLLWLHHRLRERERKEAAKLDDEVKNPEETDMGAV